MSESRVEEVIQPRICKRCGRDKTTLNKSLRYERKDGTIVSYSCPVWHRDGGDGWRCQRCYDRMRGYTKLHARRVYERRGKLRLYFLGKRIYLTFQLRKNICIRCGKIGFTHIHHLLYVPIMPWACTEELCPKCHGDDSYKLGQINVGKHSVSFFSSGRKNPNWRGGVGKIQHFWRFTPQYEEWRKAVLLRDNYSCQKCSKTGEDEEVILEAHHIKKADMYPELRYTIENGVTLCRICHYDERK